MSDDLLDEAKEAFEVCQEREEENRSEALDDIKFGRLGDHWDPHVKAQREKEGRPCLTINLAPAAIRQVVNDARQNKPSIKVRPADDKADPETAEIFSGLIRNIEATSRAGLAYDRALECAVEGGWGYFTINTKFADDDSFAMDLVIERVANPFSIFGDPYSMDADSSDWDTAFQVETLPKKLFQKRFKGAERCDWSDYEGLDANWVEGGGIRVAKYWRRIETQRQVLALDDGSIVDADVYAQQKAMYDQNGVEVIGDRTVPSHKVKWALMTGAEVLDQGDWAGKYIPIVPCYGEEVIVDGKRHFRSLIRDAKDAARMQDYWRTASTELVGLAPKAPWIGKKGAFKSDPNWDTANSESHPYLEYDGESAPQRQPFTGVPAGAIQEALNASSDFKAITGLHEASLGAPSNETSGRAIQLRQREGDTSFFHFIDNQNRAIEHGGRILVDLIPKVYTGERMVRVLGEEGKAKSDPRTVVINSDAPPPVQPPVGQEGPQGMDPTAAMVQAAGPRVYNLTVGKYDLVVSSGPSFTTKREEAATGMIELIRAFPAAAPIVAPRLMRNLDWPGADEIADDFEKMRQAQQQQPDTGAADAQAKAQIEMAKLQQQGQLKLQEMQQNAQLKMAQMQMDAELKRYQTEMELDLNRATAEAEARIKAIAAASGASASYALREVHPGGTAEG